MTQPLPDHGTRIEYSRVNCAGKYRGEVVDQSETTVFVHTDDRKTHKLLIEDIKAERIKWTLVKERFDAAAF